MKIQFFNSTDWHTTAISASNFIEIFERFQSKTLRMIVDAPWFLPNTLSEGISKCQQLKKKSNATVLNMVPASVHTQIL
jgi:hypothetical protein